MLLPAATTSVKSIFTMIGYIMKKRQIGDRNRDDRRAVDIQGHAVERACETGRDATECDSGNHAQEDPDSEQSLEALHSAV